MADVLRERWYCPRDGALLAVRTHLGQPWGFCNRCRGHFLPLSMAPALVPLLDAIIAQASRWPRSTLACPQCGRLLHTAQHAGVEIDLCSHCHAVWLDGGEVDRLALRQALAQAKEDVRFEVIQSVADATSVADLDLSGLLEGVVETLAGLLSP